MSTTRFVVGILIIPMVLACVSCGGSDCPNSDCYIEEPISPSVQYLRDYEYARNRVFDIGRLADDRLFQEGDIITRFELYQTINTSEVTRGKGGTAYEDVRDPSLSEHVSPLNARFDLLGAQGLNWVLVTEDPSRNLPYIKLLNAFSDIESSALAYYCKINRGGVSLEFGSISGDSLELQLLKPAQSSPGDPFWNAEWHNVYDLGIRNIDYNQFQLDIFKGPFGAETNPANLDHQDGVSYLQLLGLDRRTSAGSVGSDGRIDNDPSLLDLAEGLVIFPDRRPFDTDSSYVVLPQFQDSTLKDRVPEIYDSGDPASRAAASTYYLQYGIRERSPIVSVGRVNLIPETEIVTFNGRRQIRWTDYTIDYQIGQVTLLNDGLLDPAGELRICFEYCD